MWMTCTLVGWSYHKVVGTGTQTLPLQKNVDRYMFMSKICMSQICPPISKRYQIFTTSSHYRRDLAGGFCYELSSNTTLTQGEKVC